jgi:tetratricopeptide (TPR) repeat protein
MQSERSLRSSVPSTPPSCPSDNRIAAFLSGDAAALEPVERHIADCSACRELVGLRAASLAPMGSRVSPADEVGALEGSQTPAWAGDRYEVRGELARGGMGRILEGWDRRHGRPVAIKVSLHRSAALAARFEREMAVTARLQHPAIVALYDSGTLPGGEPFFVMKLVRGRSLAAAIVEATTEVDRHALLPAVLAATEALAYAHEQGVVHRDLKPANVLVGTHGETVVIDWGLAKQMGRAEESPGHAPDDAPMSVVEALPDLTVHGQALGTPCYMPPEQARGEPVDERADVYALGAMLYHVLAGVPPFVGTSSREVVDALLAGPPGTLDERAPRCPPDLAAIVKKAMARSAGDRYASAREMALDLRRHSLGQLVSAHQYSTVALLGRWARRYRTVLSMGALLVASVAVTAGLAVRRIVRERDRADAARVVAEERGRSARAHRDAAEALVDYSLVDLRKQLAPLGRLDLLGGVGTEVEKYYAALPTDEEGSHAPPTLLRRALSQDVLADVAQAQHDPAAVRAREEAALALLDEVLARDPQDASARIRRVDVELRLADALKDQGLDAEATAIGRRAADEAARLATERPSDDDAQLAAVRAEREFNTAIFGPADEQGALASEHRVVNLLEARSRMHPADVATTLDLAEAYVQLGRELGFYGHDEEMAASERDAQRVLQPLDATDSRVTDLRAKALQLESGALASLGRAAEAVDIARRSATLREALVAQDPANVDWQERLTFALANETNGLADLGRLPEAIASARREMAIMQRVVDRAPGDETAHGLLAQVMGVALAPLLAEVGQMDEVHRLVTRAEALLTPLAKPDSLRWQWVLAAVLSTAAQTELEHGRPTDALPNAERANALARALTPRSDEEVLVLLARTGGLLGRARLARRDVAGARASLESARADFDEFWGRAHDKAEWMRGGPETLGALASLLAHDGNDTGARACLDSAIASLETLDHDGRLSVSARRQLERLHSQREAGGR